ncbi:hypothetical protein ABFV62_31420 [Pseudomonas syringae]|uniref:hypothetical protein n=1 Tax=Pseudomonas syringae TaxID=317 RepID=UPI0034D675CA
MIAIKVIFEDGNTITTDINCTYQEAIEYYVGNKFQFGDTWQCPEDKLVEAIKVDLLNDYANS